MAEPSGFRLENRMVRGALLCFFDYSGHHKGAVRVSRCHISLISTVEDSGRILPSGSRSRNHEESGETGRESARGHQEGGMPETGTRGDSCVDDE